MSKGPELEAPLPGNLDAERSILGAVLLDNKALAPAMDVLKPDDFAHDYHRRIFRQMVEMGEASQPIDLVTLSDQLHKTGQLEASGGAAYIAQLVDGVPRIGHVEHYARIVKEKSLLRHLIYTTHAIEQSAMEGDEEMPELLARAQKLVTDISDRTVKRGLVRIKNIVQDGMAQLETVMSSGRAVTGLATGYPTLDVLLAGLQPSELTVLAARPSVGKTAFALNLVENAGIKEGHAIAFFSLEMSAMSLLMRLLASTARVDAHRLRTGHIGQDDWRGLVAALGRISEASLWIDDSSVSSVADISVRAQRMKRESGLELVVIDYIQLVTSGKRSSSRQEEVSDISRGLKALAKDLQVPVLALSQLSRAPEQENRRPMLSDLRNSGSIEQDADVVLFLHRPGLYTKKKEEVTVEKRAMTEVIIAKQRNGPVDMRPFVFLERYTRFEEAVGKLWGEE